MTNQLKKIKQMQVNELLKFKLGIMHFTEFMIESAC